MYIPQVKALDPENALVIHVEPIAEGPQRMLSLLDLLATPSTSPTAPLFAPTLEVLHEQIEERFGLGPGAITQDLPDNFVIKARVITTIVEKVNTLVAEDERRANLRGEAIAHKQALRRALSIIKTTTLRIELHGAIKEIPLHAGLSSYYKYHTIYETYYGDEAQIAASFRRSTFRLPHITSAQFHFIDMCLLLYYGNTRITKTRVYKLARDILEKRTQGYWIDPTRCGETVPENIVTELLDLKIPMQALLENPEKKELLTKIEMPSTGWFSGYTRYIEAQPDMGQHIITQRLGKDI